MDTATGVSSSGGGRSQETPALVVLPIFELVEIALVEKVDAIGTELIPSKSDSEETMSGINDLVFGSIALGLAADKGVRVSTGGKLEADPVIGED